MGRPGRRPRRDQALRGAARLLRERIPNEAIEVDTIDGYQGREKEAILVSLVRSNPDGQVGFLAEHRRLNVALTRARRACWVIGDAATLSVDPFLARLIEHVEQAGAHPPSERAEEPKSRAWV